MIDPSRNHFELFGLPPRFAIDADALDRMYHALQSEVHPDKHAAGSDADRRNAMAMSVRVNEAYKALKDPVERARYLLLLRGIDAFDETDTRLSTAFLEQQLTRREKAAHAADTDDLETLDAILADVRNEIRKRQARLEALLEDAATTDQAKNAVRELRFLTKVADDVDAMLASID
ncbi:MAG TPA: Fe-S protein assembly co-chaperone HscB [Casimicrobiaceae bacterium]|nr:Fe-S protein assembly co-chaperone HscB [Casimicrobiaceae bacterium]